ncbi:hypothetical protein LT493_04485 [Streptomyces tricolor]|nr:hypothetical protein [Streptomyces tricolor]
MVAVLTPYVFRTESTWQAAAWLVMLVGTVAFIAVLVRAERPDRPLGPAGGQRRLRGLIHAPQRHLPLAGSTTREGRPEARPGLGLISPLPIGTVLSGRASTATALAVSDGQVG